MQEIAVISSDGRRGFIPLENIGAALSEGGLSLENPNQEIPVISSDGRRGFIPGNQIANALNSGGLQIDSGSDTAAEIPQEEDKGDSWMQLAGKVPIKALTSFADIPQLVGGVMEESTLPKIVDRIQDLYAGRPQKLPDFLNEPSYSSRIQRGLEDLTGLDLEPNPQTTGKRIASHAGEFATALLPFGAFSKAAKGANILGKAAQAGKAGITGAGIGATSGVLQEGGVNPLVADIGSSIALPLAGAGLKGTKNLLSNFSVEGGQKKLNEAAGNILKTQVEEHNIPKVLENLNTELPLGINPVTSDLAKNPGIAGLHRLFAPNISAVAERQATNDALLRKHLASISPVKDTTSKYTGNVIRDILDKQFENAKQIRATTTKPLYDKVEQIKDLIGTPSIEAFLKKQGQYAKGDSKKALKYIADQVKSNNAPTNIIQNLDNALAPYLGAGNVNPKVAAQLEAFKTNVLKDSVSNKIVPAELLSAKQAISGRLEEVTKNSNLSRIYKNAKDSLIKDLEAVPEQQIADSAYKRLSIPVNAIEREPLLSKFIETDKAATALAEEKNLPKVFKLSPEKIPDEILAGDLNNTKALMGQIGDSPRVMNVLRKEIIDRLIKSSELASINALEQHNFSYPKYKETFRKLKPKLELILEKDQLKVLDDIGDILKRRSMTASLGIGIGSPTQPRTTLLGNLFQKDFIGKKLLSKVPGGRFAKDVIEKSLEGQNQNIQAILEAALLDPQKAKLLLTPMKDIKDANTLNAIMRNLAITAPSAIVGNEEGIDNGL